MDQNPAPMPSRVTLCIPTYRRTRWLAESIASALGQTFPDLVVEVHEDGTPDDAVADVVSQFGDPRLRFVRHAENVGIAGNFNRSLLGAATEYVLHLGDDDVAAPTLVERTVAALDANPSAGLAHARFEVIDASGASVVAEEDWLGTPSPPLEEGTAFVEKSMLEGCRVCHSTALVRRSAVPEGGFRQEDGPAFDFAFWLRMAENWDVAWIDEVLCRYREHTQSFSSSVNDLTGHGYVQTEKMLREVRAVKRRHTATLPPGRHRARLERLADRALLKGFVYRLRERTLPERRFGPTLRGLAQLARREPRLVREPTAWALLAGAVVGPRAVDRLKGRA
jgi:glycosyltransferase involved in cell wall biosynthesis